MSAEKSRIQYEWRMMTEEDRQMKSTLRDEKRKEEVVSTMKRSGVYAEMMSIGAPEERPISKLFEKKGMTSRKIIQLNRISKVSSDSGRVGTKCQTAEKNLTEQNKPEATNNFSKVKDLKTRIKKVNATQLNCDEFSAYKTETTFERMRSSKVKHNSVSGVQMWMQNDNEQERKNTYQCDDNDKNVMDGKYKQPSIINNKSKEPWDESRSSNDNGMQISSDDQNSSLDAENKGESTTSNTLRMSSTRINALTLSNIQNPLRHLNSNGRSNISENQDTSRDVNNDKQNRNGGSSSESIKNNHPFKNEIETQFNINRNSTAQELDRINKINDRQSTTTNQIGKISDRNSNNQSDLSSGMKEETETKKADRYGDNYHTKGNKQTKGDKTETKTVLITSYFNNYKNNLSRNNNDISSIVNNTSSIVNNSNCIVSIEPPERILGTKQPGGEKEKKKVRQQHQ